MSLRAKYQERQQPGNMVKEELLGAQPEDARSAVWCQSRAGSLAQHGMFEAVFPVRLALGLEDGPFNCQNEDKANANLPLKRAKLSTNKSAKGAKLPPTKNAMVKALLRDMHPLLPGSLAPPLPSVRRRPSAPEPVNLDIDLDIVVAAYAKTQVAYNI